MTNRQQTSLYIGLALGFAITANEQGLKGYKRAVTLLTSALNIIDKKLTPGQKNKVWKEIDKFVKNNPKMSVYDYLDMINNAMEIIKNGKERFLNSILALSAVNVEEEIE
jgi:hypothetical protein